MLTNLVKNDIANISVRFVAKFEDEFAKQKEIDVIGVTSKVESCLDIEMKIKVRNTVKSKENIRN